MPLHIQYSTVLRNHPYYGILFISYKYKTTKKEKKKRKKKRIIDYNEMYPGILLYTVQKEMQIQYFSNLHVNL